MKRVHTFLVVLVGVVLAMVTPARAEYLQKNEMKPLLGTLVSVDVCYVDGRQDDVAFAMDQVWDRIQEVHARMNNYDLESDVSLINAAHGQPVKVHEDVIDLIKISKKLSNTVGGVFDITIAPLIKLWKEAGEKNEYPEVIRIEEAKALVDDSKVDVIEEGWIGLLDPRIQIDLGGSAQGFAADEAARVLRENHFHNFMIDTGGEIYVAGTNCRGDLWRIGIKDPDNRDALMDVIELTDRAVSTSGDYEKYVTIKGQKWSHIINPVTGYPQNGVRSATVVAPTAVEADVLSTAMCILGPREGTRLVREIGEGYETMMVIERGVNVPGEVEWHSTPGYEDLRIPLKK